MMDTMSVVSMAHILAWDYFHGIRKVPEKSLNDLYNMIDQKSDQLGQIYGMLSRHLSKGAKLYFKSNEKLPISRR